MVLSTFSHFVSRLVFILSFFVIFSVAVVTGLNSLVFKLSSRGLCHLSA